MPSYFPQEMFRHSRTKKDSFSFLERRQRTTPAGIILQQEPYNAKQLVNNLLQQAGIICQHYLLTPEGADALVVSLEKYVQVQDSILSGTLLQPAYLHDELLALFRYLYRCHQRRLQRLALVADDQHLVQPLDILLHQPRRHTAALP